MENKTIEINRKQLQKALEIVKPGLASKEMIAQSTSFAFMNGKVVTYNDEISVSHPVEGLDLQGAIEADHLYKLLAKLKQEIIKGEIREGNEIVLKSGRAKAGLTLQAEIKLPLKGIFEVEEWYELPDNFVKLVSFAANSAGHDMSRPILTCVHINEEGYVEASDGIRITRGEFTSDLPVDTFLLPATSASTMVKLVPTEIAQGKGWMHFRTEEGTILSCRLFDRDEYPSTEHLFKVEGVDLILPKISNQMLEKAMVFAKREHETEETVQLALGEGMLTMTSSSDTGWFEEETRVRYKGETIKFSISPHLLREILNESLTCLLAEDRIKFEGQNWRYVAMLKSAKKQEDE